MYSQNHSTDLQSQLDLLKEKIKEKEKEVVNIIDLQKEEYESKLKERDEELTIFVDNIIKENILLKKQIITLEIDVESYKEKLQFLGETENDSESYDKIFYENLKAIKTSSEIKQKEIYENYEKLNKNFIRENKSLVSTLRKMALEKKQKFLNDNNINNIESENLISLSTFEEQISVYENRIRLLYEELKNKEKYGVVIEQKYEMMNEENKLLKRKLHEEKTILLKMINEIQSENNTNNENILQRINFEITEKKEEFEKTIKSSLSQNEAIIEDLIKQKDNLLKQIEKLELNSNDIKNQLSLSQTEKEELELILQNKESEITELNNIIQEKGNKITQLTYEKEIIKKSNDDLLIKINEYIVNITSLETQNKLINNSINREIEKSESRNKQIIESLNTQIIETDKKIRLLNNENNILKDKIEKTDIVNKELKEENKTLRQNVDSLSSELNKEKINHSVIVRHYEELKNANDKLKQVNQNVSSNSDIKEKLLNELKDKVSSQEIEINSLKKEIERVDKLKDEMIEKYEEANRAHILVSSQHDTLKIANNIEIQRLKNQNIELEKLTEKANKMSFIENSNNELKKELKELKLGLNRLYKTYLSKTGNTDNNSTITIDEFKIIEELENSFDKIISTYEEDIQNLKNKLNTVIQITNSVNSSNSNNINSINSASLFKQIEKEKSGSLYERLIVYLKNEKLKHLLEIFQLNIQREEEIRNILNDKPTQKRQISDLITNFNSLKQLCEQTFSEYEQRSKTYILHEDFEKQMEEHKSFTQDLIDMILQTLMNYKIDFSDAIVFKMPINDYNQLIENISVNIDNFNRKVNGEIESYKGNVDKAIDVLHMQTQVDFDVIQNLMGQKII